MSYVTSNRSAQQPVSLDYIKSHSVVAIDDDDVLISSYIKSATLWAEDFTNRAIVKQSVNLYLDKFSEVIRLPRPLLQSVVSINYKDSAGVLTLLASSEYSSDSISEPATLYPSYGKSWPSTRVEANSVNIEYLSGYEDTENVPEDIKTAISIYVASMYMDRENPTIPDASKIILLNYRILPELVDL